jgi:hypothetical protein
VFETTQSNEKRQLTTINSKEEEVTFPAAAALPNDTQDSDMETLKASKVSKKHLDSQNSVEVVFF